MKIGKKRAILSALLAALVLTTSLAACGTTNADPQASASTTAQTSKNVVKIAYLPITHSLPLFVETELQKQNPNLSIELVKYSSWTELMDALNTGRVDGASVLIELAMKAKAQGIDLKAAALGHHDGNVVVVKEDIHSVADLKGKNFAVPNKQSSHYLLLNQMLAENNLSISDVNVIELSPTEMPVALVQGQVDGYCVAEPFGAKAVSLNVGKVLYESPEIWEDSVCCALVLHGDFLKERPDVAKELVTQYTNAGTYIEEHKAESNEIAKQYLGVDENTLEVSMKWISYGSLAITREAYNDLCGKMKTFGVLDTLPSYEEFVDTSLLES